MASAHPICLTIWIFIWALYEAKYLDQIFSQTFFFIEGHYLAQIKFQIAKQIGFVHATLMIYLLTIATQTLDKLLIPTYVYLHCDLSAAGKCF